MKSNIRIMKSRVSEKVLYPELSYEIVGCLFEVHNELGRFAKEKQYSDLLSKIFNQRGVKFEKEKRAPFELVDRFTNQVDFDINDQIILELKAKIAITKDDYNQLSRYLDASNRKLGILVNFRNKYLKPIRVIRSYS